VDLSRVAIVLVDPQEPGNVGAAARAMANMGLSRLILVRPVGHLDSSARRMAIGGRKILEEAEVRSSLGEALEGFTFVVGTTRREGSVRSGKVSPRAAAEEIAGLSSSNDLAILFGREDRGLTNREIERCQRIVTVPTAAGKASLNLAQAVLVMAYELFLNLDEKAALLLPSPEGKLAPHPKLEQMYEHMESALLRIGYLQEDNPRRMMRRFRRIFGRAGLNAGEVQALRGVFHQMEWYVRSKAAERHRKDG
jgi:tRNA/rRNA methyltransferase